MTLRSKQSLFVKLVAQLIDWAYAQGYEITFSEAYRPPFVAEEYARRGVGIKTSLHCSRLAIDLNLFKDGKYLTRTKDHEPLGEYWKNLHPLCRWGGDFRRRDGNHYSMTHRGRA